VPAITQAACVQGVPVVGFDTSSDFVARLNPGRPQVDDLSDRDMSAGKGRERFRATCLPPDLCAVYHPCPDAPVLTGGIDSKATAHLSAGPGQPRTTPTMIAASSIDGQPCRNINLGHVQMFGLFDQRSRAEANHWE